MLTPMSFDDAVKEEKWREAMNNEIQSIEKNNTWSLINLSKGAWKVGVKWIYKTKRDENGEVVKHKTRLVAKGYSQREGVDYTEVYAPVERLDTVRTIIALAASRRWNVYQLDVKSAFLHGNLKENVYVEQPKGYQQKGKEHTVYQLHKALYGLTQAPRAWFNLIEAYFLNGGFHKCLTEQTLFTKQSRDGHMVIVSIYVDDLLFTGDNTQLLFDFKKSMMKEFEITDMGNMSYFLGIGVLQKEGGFFIYKRKYALEVLKKFGMVDSKMVGTPIGNCSRFKIK